MAALKLNRTPDGVGAIFPDDVLARMNLGEGDTLEIVQTPEGILLTPSEPSFAEEMAIARKIMNDNAAVLDVLAK